MNILTVNAGSSSLKFNLIRLPEETELISGNFEKIGLAGGIYTIKINGSKIKKETDKTTNIVKRKSTKKKVAKKKNKK